MKKVRNIALIVGIILGALVIAWLVATFAGNYFQSPAEIDAPVSCIGKHADNHLVTIKNDKAMPYHTYAPRCDTMTIKNEDNEIRLIAFGPHEHHVAYDGVKEKVLGPGQSLTITLDAAGLYHFHDHIHDEMKGEFTVSP